MKATISYAALQILEDRKNGRLFVNAIRDEVNKLEDNSHQKYIKEVATTPKFIKTKR